MMETSPKVSIIVAVFNAEKTIHSLLDSIERQKNSGIEIVFVDDGSTDKTGVILEEFISKESDCRCNLVHQKNQGAAAARNVAIDLAQGTWLAFADADDSFCENGLNLIIDHLSEGMDILGWDWLNDNNGKVRRMYQADYATPVEALTNLMGGTMKWNLWLFAVRRKLVNDFNIRFIDGADMGEDMTFILKSFASAQSVRQIHQPVYRYNACNPFSISARMDDRRRKEVTVNLNAAEEFLLQSPYADLCTEYLPYLKLYIKRPLLIGTSKPDYKLWASWFHEVNEYATKNHKLPLRTRILQWLASKQLWSLVFLYNIIVYRILYRFVEIKDRKQSNHSSHSY